MPYDQAVEGLEGDEHPNKYKQDAVKSAKIPHDLCVLMCASLMFT